MLMLEMRKMSVTPEVYLASRAVEFSIFGIYNPLLQLPSL